ncbi:hypothetical protein AB0H82_07110 [Streptomyces sp. NPDC050732]|uniref:hypothetical protein n=1 Tax=Streptomyces sp. NPDC050732 TaxID=3154632 RepID=UPI00342800CA
MFRQLTRQIPGGAELLFRLHPIDLTSLLEQAWTFQRNDLSQPVGHPDHRSDIPGLPERLQQLFEGFDRNRRVFSSTSPDDCRPGYVRWEHLSYAYMLESTRLLEIFRRVVALYREGEELGVPSNGAEHWLRNTEELFFRESAPFFITALPSLVRPNGDSIRRNAYYRMFGMDLTHPAAEPYPKPAAANTQFVSIFEEFLRETWIGIINVRNTIGPNPTDHAKIADLAERLSDMLTTRRLASNLSREEFWAISTMAWFHLTLDFNSPIVSSLRAEATSPEQRLFRIAERVRIPAHAMSKSFFDIADAISRLLINIETKAFDDAANVPVLFNDPLITPDVQTVITHWSITTGRDLKAPKVAPNP